MKFKIDKRYIAIQTLKAIGGYMFGIIVVLIMAGSKVSMDFVGTSLFASIIVYFLCFFPRIIFVKDGAISFVEKNSFERTKVNLADIIHIKNSHKFYNTMTITTKSGIKHNLYPKDANALADTILSRK